MLNLIYLCKICWKLVIGRFYEERFLKISVCILWSVVFYNFWIYFCFFFGNRRYDFISKCFLLFFYKWEENRDIVGFLLSVLRLVINKGCLVYWVKLFWCVIDLLVYISIYWWDWLNKEIFLKVLLIVFNDLLWWLNGDVYLGFFWFGWIC